MTFQSAFNKMYELFSFGVTNNKATTQQNNAQSPISSSVFAGKDIKGFAEIIKAKGETSPNSLFAQANETDIKILFDRIDTNKDGKIDENEAKAISGYDGDISSLSDEDFNSLCEEIQQSIYDQEKKQVEADNLAARQAYQNQFGGANYQNYGSRTANGSYLSSNEQYSIKKKLENIENTEIPKLKEEKEKIEKENQEYIKTQNEKIEELLKKEDETLGELDTKYQDKQKEIDECDEKITEQKNKIQENKNTIHKANSQITYLEAELANLKTDTDNEEINTQNKKRKAEIEKQITEEKEKITKANEQIKLAEEEQKKQEELKETKKGELQTIQDKIKEVSPKTAEAIEKIKTDIAEANKKTQASIEKIDKKIETLQAQAIEYQKDLGTRAGKAASMTGSAVVNEALKLAAGELGTRESGKNNGAVSKYRNGVANSAPWCASFVSYLYGAGQGSDNKGTFGYQASVAGIKNKAISAGFYSSKGNYTPKPGDIVIMQNGCSHTSIVESVSSNGAITTIGGNEGNAVRRRTYQPGSRGYAKISGFVRMTDWQNKIS